MKQSPGQKDALPWMMRLVFVCLSISATAQTGDITPPAAPTGLAATASNGGIALDWTDNAESDLAGYDVFRASSSSGPYTKLNPALLTASFYNDAAAQPGVTSYYAVYAIDNSGNRSAAAFVSSARLFSKITWTTAAPASLKRFEAFGAVVNGKLYLFGGYYGDPNYTPTQRADVYDPVANTWSRIANLPIGLTHVGVAVDGDNIYLAGGYPTQPSGVGQNFSTTAVWKYSTAANTYTSMPALPAARGGGALVLIDRTLHYFGGSNASRKDAGTHWTLNIDTGTAWTTRAALPTPRNHLGAAVLNGKIYAIGGQSGQDAAAIYRSNVDAYDPVTNTWMAVASLPQVRSHHNASTFVMGGRIIVVGGESAYSNAKLANVTAYNPALNAWMELTPLPARRTAAVAAQINGIIYETTGNALTTYKGTPVAP